MASSKHEFFHKGVLNQITPDIIVSFKRPDSKKLKEWAADQSESLKEFLQTCENSFTSFKEEVLSSIESDDLEMVEAIPCDVCLGEGRINYGYGDVQDCHKCDGSGLIPSNDR
jgi:DnaJ-class molecular chaperone